jgi:hypothetical protein
MNLYMFRAVPLPIIRRSSTVYLALVYLKIALEQGPVLLESYLQTCMVYTSAKCTVIELLIMCRGTARNM